MRGGGGEGVTSDYGEESSYNVQRLVEVQGYIPTVLYVYIRNTHGSKGVISQENDPAQKIDEK